MRSREPGPLDRAHQRLENGFVKSSFSLGRRLLAEREDEALPDEGELEEFLFAVKGAEGRGLGRQGGVPGGPRRPVSLLVRGATPAAVGLLFWL